MAFGPDDNTVVSTGADKKIRLWDVKAGKTIGTLDGEWSVAISPDGKTLASANEGIKLWDLTTRKNIATFDGHKQVRALAFSPDGKTLASGSTDKSIKLWDVRTGKNTATLEAHQKSVLSLAFNPDGKTLVSGASGPFQQNLKLWDVTTGKNTATLQGHVGSFGAESVVCVVFSPDGKTLASGGHTIQLGEGTTGKMLAVLEGHEVGGGRSLAFGPNGKTLAAGGLLKDYTIKLWDVSQVSAKPEKAKRDGDAPQQPGPEAVDITLAGRITKEKDAYVLTDAKGKKIRLTLLALRDPSLSGNLIEPDWIRLYLGQDVVVSGRGLLSNLADPTTLAHLAVTKVEVERANK